MGRNSAIEWTDHTFSAWIGCTQVSPGCHNCYAEAMMDKRLGRVQWGPHGERKRTSEAYWRQPLKWDREVPPDKRQRVFCASLSDWLDNQVPQQWRIDLALLIDQTPSLDWLLLTKRIENFRNLSPWPVALSTGGQIPFPENVWLGVTAEDQEHYNKRWNILATIPATVRFISYEPALGPLTPWPSDHSLMYPDWIICGAESGRKARTMNPAWARALRDSCAERSIAFFMKQMSSKAHIPDDLMVREFPNAHHSNTQYSS